MVLLDTHTLLWWQAGGGRLSARAGREIARAERILVSPISCWETAMLVDKGRVSLDRPVLVWVRDLFQQERVEPAPLLPAAATEAGRLPGLGFLGDPADAQLYASARDLAVPFVTKDARIRDFARAAKDLRVIW